MTFISHFDKLQIYPCLFPGFLNFHVLNLNCEKFKLYIQNTLNMLKTTRVYFGVLHVILGMDWLKVHRVVIDCDRRRVIAYT